MCFVWIECLFNTLAFYYTFFTNATIVIEFQPKIKTTTGTLITVQSCTMELGGIVAVMHQTLIGNTTTEPILLMLMVLISFIGKDINTL